MKLKDIKSMIVLPLEEIHIKKTVIINDMHVYFMCLTHSKKNNTIWAIYENVNNDNDIYEQFHDSNSRTNRELMKWSVEKSRNTPHISISKLYIQGNLFTVSSSRSGNISDHDIEGYMRLQHFSESGLLPEFLNETELKNLCIATYSQQKNEKLLIIDTTKSIDLKIITRKEPETSLINDSITLGFNQLDVNKYSFYDSLIKKDCTYYLQPLEIYDIWKELENRFEN